MDNTTILLSCTLTVKRAKTVNLRLIPTLFILTPSIKSPLGKILVKRKLAMSTAIEPAEISSLGQESGFASPNTLFPSILATVILCSSLTTLFTAARLTTKRLVSTYDVEDCEFQLNQRLIEIEFLTRSLVQIS